jgi:hypothetical protein
VVVDVVVDVVIDAVVGALVVGVVEVVVTEVRALSPHPARAIAGRNIRTVQSRAIVVMFKALTRA